MSIFVSICIWVVGFYRVDVLGALISSLEFCSLDYDKDIVTLSCLFDAIAENLL